MGTVNETIVVGGDVEGLGCTSVTGNWVWHSFMGREGPGRDKPEKIFTVNRTFRPGIEILGT